MRTTSTVGILTLTINHNIMVSKTYVNAKTHTKWIEKVQKQSLEGVLKNLVEHTGKSLRLSSLFSTKKGSDDRY